MRQVTRAGGRLFLGRLIGLIPTPTGTIDPGIRGRKAAIDYLFGSSFTDDHIGQLKGGVVGGGKPKLILGARGNLLREPAVDRDWAAVGASDRGRNGLAGTHPVAKRAGDDIAIVFHQDNILDQGAGTGCDAFLGRVVGRIVGPTGAVDPGIIDGKAPVDRLFSTAEPHRDIL